MNQTGWHRIKKHEEILENMSYVDRAQWELHYASDDHEIRRSLASGIPISLEHDAFCMGQPTIVEFGDNLKITFGKNSIIGFLIETTITFLKKCDFIICDGVVEHKKCNKDDTIIVGEGALIKFVDGARVSFDITKVVVFKCHCIRVVDPARELGK